MFRLQETSIRTHCESEVGVAVILVVSTICVFAVEYLCIVINFHPSFKN